MVSEALFEFTSWDDWLDNAGRRFRRHEVSSFNTHCLDSKGRECQIGKDFARARDENAFPVRVFSGSAPTSSAEQK